MNPPRIASTVNTPDGIRANFRAIGDFTERVAGVFLDGPVTTVAWSSLSGTPTDLTGYGITSPLPIDQGGTGAASAKDARTALGVPAVTVNDTEPASPSNGDLWFTVTSKGLYVYYDGDWYDTSGTIKP